MSTAFSNIKKQVELSKRASNDQTEVKMFIGVYNNKDSQLANE